MTAGLIPTLRYRTMHLRVIDVLGLELVSGRIAPGETLPPEPVLSEQLGVSRGVVREAVKALAAKGMLELRPRTGTRVLPQAKWNLLDGSVLEWLKECDRDSLIVNLTEVRRMIEPSAAALAAERATPEECRELLAAASAMTSAFDASVRGAFTEADTAFHHVLLRMSHNPLLAALNSSLEVALHATFETTAAAPGALSTTLPLHHEVVKAIEARDAAAAFGAMQRLIDTSAAHYEEVRGGRS